MSQTNQLILRGPDFVKPNSVHVQRFGAHTVCGLTPGKARTLKQKLDRNEDSLGLFELPESQGHLFLLADAHYGAESGIFAIEHFLEFLDKTSPKMEKGLFHTHLNLDDEIRSHQSTRPDGHSATTLLSVLVQDNHVHAVSTGDSNLYLLRNQQMIPINTPHHSLFLGDRTRHPNRTAEVLLDRLPEDGIVDAAETRTIAYFLAHTAVHMRKKVLSEDVLDSYLARVRQSLPRLLNVTTSDFMQPWSPLNLHITNDLPEISGFELRSGDYLLMTTDGANEPTSGCSPTHQGDILNRNSGNLEKMASELLGTILKKGGRDNCALILHHVKRDDS